MADEKNNEVRGIERAAILLMSLGEASASEVLKHMAPKEVQNVGAAMAQLENVSRGQVTSVLKEFCTTVQEETGLGLGTDEYVRSVLKKALGDDKAENLIDRILQGGNTKGLETLKWMDSRAVARLFVWSIHRLLRLFCLIWSRINRLKSSHCFQKKYVLMC